MPRWGTWSLIAGCIVMPVIGCDDEPEVSETASSETASSETGSRETSSTAAADETLAAAEDDADEGPAIGPTGTAHGEPFVTRGVLAQRRRASDPVEIRLLTRAASCDTFDADYESREGEPVVVMYLAWPKAEGDQISFGAREVHERIQFCTGRSSGTTRCEPRAQEQGSLTVVEASPESGVLSFDVASPQGTLSGTLPFTLCAR